MPQGKFKLKTKVPNQKQKQKGKAFTRRPNAPIQPKKQQFTEQQKLKQMVSKNVNRVVEDEIRGRAKEGHINLSKAQQAVAKQQKEKTNTIEATTSK
ncbi:uncharacterized protein LOC116348334 [Contarinia nasturtii]|uniref:uncharacterized protein LOC116348334 n=1 Tax=Contarinia nasturtii TaxID=265458 RepID=UPI0012D43871|nr:uncharacterized protein LOC116348334 [Contarinia nasturtii]